MAGDRWLVWKEEAVVVLITTQTSLVYSIHHKELLIESVYIFKEYNTQLFLKTHPKL